jgi:4-amino-4-deoxy-L-arabinose transferase-like glycosyltransferase
MQNRSGDWLRFIGVLLALGLALAAQSLLTQQPHAFATSQGARLGAAIVLLAAAMATFAVATRRTPLPSDRTLAPDPGKDSGPVPRRQAFWLYLAAACYLSSLLIYITLSENALVRWLWLGGVVILIVSQIPPVAFLAGRLDRFRAAWREWVIVALILAIGLGLRVWRLAEIPSNLEGDISSIGLQALGVVERPQTPWFSVGWAEKPMFYYVMAAWSMRLFGQDVLGLMMGSVIAGTLTILAVYLLGREISGRRAGLIAAALLDISYTHIHFSRIVITETSLPFITLLFFFLFRGLRTRQRVWFVAAGLALGVGLLTYYAVRVAPVIVILTCLWMLIWRRCDIVGQRRNWAAFGLSALIGFGPMLGFTLFDFGSFMGRANEVTLMSPDVRVHLMNKYQVGTLGELLVEQVKRTFLTYHLYGDASTHFMFPGPMVDALTAALLVCGVGYALSRLRDPRRFVLVAWVVSVLVLGGCATNNPPYWPHLVITLPAVAVLAALAAVRAWEALARPWGQPGQWIVGAVLIMAVIYVGVGNWRAYYEYVRDNATMRVRMIRFMNSLPADYAVRLVSDQVLWQDREFQFLARNRSGADVTADDVRAESGARQDRPIVFAVTLEHLDVVPHLQRLYPGGQVWQHEEPGGQVSFVSYTFAPPGYEPPPAGAGGYQALVMRLLVLGGAALICVAAALLLVRHHAAVEKAFRRATGYGLAEWRQWLPRWTSMRQPAEPHQRSRAALIGVVLALGLGYLAQGVLDAQHGRGLGPLFEGAIQWPESTRLWVGGAIYLAALILWARAAPFKAADPARTSGGDRLARFQLPHAGLPGAARFILLGLGLGLYLVSVALFATRGEDSLVRWLWAGGLALFLAAWLPWRRGAVHSQAEYSPPFRRAHVALLVVILLAALWLRLYRLEVIPSDFHGDMASHGLEARANLLGQDTRLFVSGWANLPRMAFFPAALFMRVAGDNLLGLQLTSVAGGMVSLVGLYLLVWRLFDRHRLAALATSVAAINIPHIHFSRIAEYMDPWPFAVLALYLIVDGLKARRLLSLALAGVLMGLSFQMYYSGRVVPLIVGVFLLYAFFFQRRWVTQNRGGLGLLALGFFIALGPSLVFDVEHWDAFLRRSREVYLFDPAVMAHLQDKYKVTSQAAVVLEQVKLSLWMFNHSVDTSTQFGFTRPMFDSLLAPLVVLGVGGSLRRWRQPGVALALVWLAFIMIVGSMLTVDAPFWPRLVGVLAAAGLLAALALEQTWELVEAWGGWRVGAIFGVALAVLLVVAGRQNWDLYYRTVRDNARPDARVGRFLNSLPPQVAACGFLDPLELRVRETYFLAWPRQVVDLEPDGMLDQCPDPPQVWILSPNHLDRLDAIRAHWPGGAVQEHLDRANKHVFTSYLVGEASSGWSLVSQVQADYASDWMLGVVTALAVISLIWLSLSGQGRPDQWQSVPLNASLARKLALVWAGPLAALFLAFLAQWLYGVSPLGRLWPGVDGASVRWAGAAVSLVAMLVWALTTPARAWGPMATSRETLSAELWPARSMRRALRPWTMVRGLGLVCSAFAVLYSAIRGQDELVRWLWIGGAVLFVLSTQPWRVARRFFAPGVEGSPPFKSVHLFFLAGILAAALALRAYRLSSGLDAAGLIVETLSLPVIYLLVWRIFDRHRLAALTTALVAISAGRAEYSFFAGSTDTWFLGWLALFLFADGLRARRAASLAGAGVVIGVGLLTGPAAWVVVLCMAVFLLYAYVFRRPWVTENTRGLALAAIGVSVTMGPGLVSVGLDWGANIQRAQFGYLRPILDSPTWPLLILGLGYGVLRWRTPGMVLMLSLLGLTLAWGGMLPVDTPAWSRLAGVILPASLLAALPLDQLWDLVGRCLDSRFGNSLEDDAG